MRRDVTALLQQGLGFHREGRLGEAESIYRQILKADSERFDVLVLLAFVHFQRADYNGAIREIDRALRLKPDNAEAFYNRGLALQKLSRFDDAVASYDRAVALKPDYAEAFYNRAHALNDLNRCDEALASFDRAVALKPRYADAFNNRGNTLLKLRRLDDAVASYDRAITLRPDYAEAFYNRGNVLQDLKRLDEALASYDTAIALKPDYAGAFNSRGNTLAKLGRQDEAVASYDKAVALKPNYDEAFYNRGLALQNLKRLDEALATYNRAIALKPDYVEAFNNRGNVLQNLKRLDEALASYDTAIALKPDYAGAFTNRGNALQELDRFEEALASHNKALAVRPDFAEAYVNRGATFRELGRIDEARASFAKAVALKPSLAAARFGLCVAELPVLYSDEREIAAQRAAYEQRLTELCDAQQEPGVNLAELADGVGLYQPFYLAYQGFNDRDLQALYGSFVCRIMAERYPAVASAPPPAANEPVRLGIVSGFFCNHSNWKLPIKGWLSQLDRRRFRIFCYHTGVRQDEATKTAAALCDRFVQSPLPLPRWRAEILADAPHVLIYPEIGMDAVAIALAAQRLASVQCNSWGHPDTSGLPTLDYYLSSDLMEPPDGEHHYTERLVRLPNLSVYCERLEAPRVMMARHDLGLRTSATAYWCGQSLFKYLPQFDEVFPRIACAAGDCQFVFIEHKSARITELFRRRLDRAFAAFALKADAHCLFLPRLNEQEFIGAAGQCDIVLDSIGWSGCNSTLESLPYDLPIVTMAGSLMRGRHGMAILQRMGVTETIVETIDDYVSTAVRLARDLSWRNAVKAKIAACKHRIYYDKACISALEQFLDRVGRQIPGN